MSKKEKNADHIVHAHDRSFKQAMTNKNAAKEFFQSSLSKELAEKINWDVFELQSGSHVDRRHKELIVDVLYRTEIEGHSTYLYLLVNHQSTVDKFMPFWTIQYTCNIIDKHLEIHSTIPLVIPLVVYHGIQPWNCSTNINDLVDADKILVDKYFLKPFQLIDLNKITDEELQKQPWWGALALTLKHIYARNMTPYLQFILDLLKLVQELENGKKYAEGIIFYIFNRGEIDKEDFLEKIQAQLSPEIGEDVMTVAEQLKKEGIQQGIQQGIQKAQMEIAARLLENHENLSNIAKITGLSLEKIEELKKSLH